MAEGPLAISIFSSMSVLSLRQRASRPAAANARLKRTASLPTSSMMTASASVCSIRRSTAPKYESHAEHGVVRREPVGRR